LVTEDGDLMQLKEGKLIPATGNVAKFTENAKQEQRSVVFVEGDK
jgi:hypothetical protein